MAAAIAAAMAEAPTAPAVEPVIPTTVPVAVAAAGTQTAVAWTAEPAPGSPAGPRVALAERARLARFQTRTVPSAAPEATSGSGTSRGRARHVTAEPGCAATACGGPALAAKPAGLVLCGGRTVTLRVPAASAETA